MRQLFAVCLELFWTLLILSPFIYGLYALGILYYAGLVLVGLVLLIILFFILWYLDCRGQSGCLSGVILAPVVFLLPLGLILLALDYFVK
ncbi:MAG: hypothetical protein WBF77_02380 [Sulfurimonadaceae bacterium]